MAAPKSSGADNVVARARGRGAKGSRTGRAGSRGGSAWELFKTVAGALVIYLLIKTLLLEAFRIPSGSMIPTLLIGDWLFVNKLVYGPQIPLTRARLPGYSEPRRGEVVVFESPFQPDEAQLGNDPTPTLVKRLVGMPGDTLFMRRGLLHVNGVPQRQGFATATNPVGGPETTPPDATSPLMAWQHRYALRGTRFGAPPQVPLHDHWGPLLVPPGHYFMMGDNRYCSKDSRYWGLVPRGNVKGRPWFVYYSYRPADLPSACAPDVSDRPVAPITDIRWSRIGDVIR